MDSKVSILNCFYGDVHFTVVSDDTIAYLAGGGICLWNIETGVKNMLWSSKQGYCAMASNYHTSQIAAFEYGRNPELHIFDLRHETPALRIKNMAYSRDGLFLVVVSGRPDYSVIIYDIQQNRELEEVTLKLPHKASEHVKIKFSPDDSKHFAILSRNDIIFYTLERAFELNDLEYPLAAVEDAPPLRYLLHSQSLSKQLLIERNEVILQSQQAALDLSTREGGGALEEQHVLFEELLEPAQVELTSFIFDKFGNAIMTSTANQLYLVATHNLASRVTLPLPSPASSIILTQKHLIVALNSGIINWMLVTYPDERLRTGLANMLSPHDISYELRLPSKMEFVQMHYNKSFTRLIASTRMNEILYLDIEAERYSENDDDQDQDGEERPKKQLTAPIHLIGTFHSHPIVAAIEIPGSTQMVSLDEAGLLMVWEMTTAEVLDKFVFPLVIEEGSQVERPCSAAVDQKGYILIIGFTSGIVRVVDLTRRSTEPIRPQVSKHSSVKGSAPNLLASEEELKEDLEGGSGFEGIRSSENIRVIRVYHLYDSSISQIVMGKTNTAAILSRDSPTIYFIDFNIKTTDPAAPYLLKLPVLAHLQFPSKVMGGTWIVEKGETKLLIALHNAFIATVKAPSISERDTSDPGPDSGLYRRVDCGMKMAIFNPMTKDIFVTGDDKYIKKYGFPALPWEQAKEWILKAPEDPLLEYEGHPMPSNTWCINGDTTFIISGGRDGSIIVRATSNVGAATTLKAHHIRGKGVLSLYPSSERTHFLSAGGSGEIMLWAIGNQNLPALASDPVKLHDDVKTVLESMETVTPLNSGQWWPKLQSELMVDAFFEKQQPLKLQYQQEMEGHLEGLRQSLREYLKHNQEVEEIEQLERQEFVINQRKEEGLEIETAKLCDEIRVKAERDNLKLQLLHAKVKARTWDTMAVQQRAITAIKGEKLVYNYGIRERTSKEKRRLEHIQNLRRVEMTDQLLAFELESKNNTKKGPQRQSTLTNNTPPSQSGINMSSAVPIDQFSKVPEGYLINRTAGKMQFPEIEVEIPKPTDKPSAQSPTHLGVTGDKAAKEDAVNPIYAILSRFKRQGKFGGGSKLEKEAMMRKLVGKAADSKPGKPASGVDAQTQGRVRQAAVQDDRGDVEIKWGIEVVQKTLDELRKGAEMLGSPDLLYGGFELFTPGRKRMQIQLLQDVIFQLKEEFNTEFEALEKQKEQQTEQIIDKNARIRELLEELKERREIFEPPERAEQHPERILKVKDEEITVEKYLTKEQRQVLEKERLAEEARLRELSGDTLGTRGITSMMGGTLEVKKGLDKFEASLEQEEWMKKNPQEMNEEEKKKFKEYEIYMEEREKQRKAWDQELKKTSADINQICIKFQEKLDHLFKKKLFYDYRIYEQELYIIRLSLSLREGESLSEEREELEQKAEELHQKLMVQEDKIGQFAEAVKLKEGEVPQLRKITKLESVLRDYEKSGQKLMMDFINGKRRGAGPGGNEVAEDNPLKIKENELISRIVQNDPFSEYQIKRIKEEFAEKYELDPHAFNFEQDAPLEELSEQHFYKLIELRQERFMNEKQHEKANKELEAMELFVKYLEMERNEVADELQQIETTLAEASHKVMNNALNIETLVRIRQLEVEVSQAPVATDFREAVLVNRRELKNMNHAITRRGDLKVEKLQNIVKKKQQLECVRWEERKLDLEIKDLTEKALDVQMFRVTKEKQEILQGKHVGREKDDIERLEKQIKQLNQNAEKRIETIEKKRKKLLQEIKERRLENDQLEALARKMKSDVEQRNQIMDLKSEGTDSAEDPSRKFKELAEKRKLNQIVKQRTEEIEFLRDELDRLRERTFPSFAHLHAKNEFPDEQPA